MLQIKGYKPSKKCAIYVKKMISRGFWKVNEKISTIQQISEKLAISAITVRKVIRQFERSGTIKNWGPLGFYLASNFNDNIKPVSKNLRYLNILKTNISAFDLLNSGGIKIRNWVIKHIKDTGEIIGLNEISGTLINTSLKELSEISYNFLILEEILNISDIDLFESKMKMFNRQRDLMPIAKLTTRYKRELDINE